LVASRPQRELKCSPATRRDYSPPELICPTGGVKISLDYYGLPKIGIIEEIYEYLQHYLFTLIGRMIIHPYYLLKFVIP
jgi:hypothetical protein